MLDFILKYFEIEEREKTEIKEEVQKAGIKNFTDIFLLVCGYENENIYDRYNIIENYIKAS